MKNFLKMNGMKLATVGTLALGAFSVATSAGATTTLSATDVSTMVTSGITSLSTEGGAIIGALVVIIVALILFGFGVKRARKHVK